MTDHRKRIYTAWNNMRQRCYNESRRDYPWYGARGITVCPEWHHFPTFYSWAVGNGYGEGLTLDRIDTNGPYSPGNCRWATRKTQANNRRTTRFITMGDRTQSVTEWAEELAMDATTLWRRLDKGWPVERALTEPVHIEKRNRGVRS